MDEKRLSDSIPQRGTDFEGAAFDVPDKPQCLMRWFLTRMTYNEIRASICAFTAEELAWSVRRISDRQRSTEFTTGDNCFALVKETSEQRSLAKDVSVNQAPSSDFDSNYASKTVHEMTERTEEIAEEQHLVSQGSCARDVADRLKHATMQRLLEL
jgi:hypothetical protein